MATSGIETPSESPDQPRAGAGDGIIKNAVLIAGPTASGKSALALEMAEREGGTIVNADSMQVYSVLEVLTARPRADDLARVPHLLYGHVHPSTAYSTGVWLRDVAAQSAAGRFDGLTPIFAGGTGLYFNALVEGLSAMPDIPDLVRERWRYRLKEDGSTKLHAILMREDSAVAMLLKATDGQRIVRALEVLEVSGRSILDWQRERGRPLIDRATARLLVIEPERAELVRRIEARFDRMVEAGGLEEARALDVLKLDPALPAMKAIGFRELLAADRGEMSLDEAIERAKTATRQYSKRQSTWFRNQFGPEWRRISRSSDAASVRV